ncbi:hypothetical protein CEQ90_10690 [Lewinellaceae bacterium SD302]|nr:hypothetical protein CEQ90_10690 [Lewinellaceae bacterium SD302]
MKWFKNPGSDERGRPTFEEGEKMKNAYVGRGLPRPVLTKASANIRFCSLLVRNCFGRIIMQVTSK